METNDKYSILVVDDEKSNLMVLNSILSGYSVYTAKSGEKALLMVSDNRPDLILLDIVMPGIDGFEVLSRLKESPLTSGIPVIIITGMDDPDCEKKGMALGAAGYIAKPFDAAAVERLVDAQLRPL